MPAEVSSFHPVGTLTAGIEKGDSSLPNGKAFWFDGFVTGKRGELKIGDQKRSRPAICKFITRRHGPLGVRSENRRKTYRSFAFHLIDKKLYIRIGGLAWDELAVIPSVFARTNCGTTGAQGNHRIVLEILFGYSPLIPMNLARK
jgi:hypothetical protein